MERIKGLLQDTADKAIKHYTGVITVGVHPEPYFLVFIVYYSMSKAKFLLNFKELTASNSCS